MFKKSLPNSGDKSAAVFRQRNAAVFRRVNYIYYIQPTMPQGRAAVFRQHFFAEKRQRFFEICYKPLLKIGSISLPKNGGSHAPEHLQHICITASRNPCPRTSLTPTAQALQCIFQ